MSTAVVLAVLLGAALHASWNVAIRAGADRRRETAMLALCSALLSGVVLVMLPLPRGVWLNLALSAALHGVYFVLVAEAYARGGVALAYPLMRGVAPMLTTFAAWALLGERLSPVVLLGIAAISVGVALLARHRRDANERAAVVIALANSVVIAAYTLNDAVGARASAAPFGYALWVFVLSAVPTLAWLAPATLRRLPTRAEALRGSGGAACSIGSYALALWAMTQAPVAPVSALRETAMLFGLVLARVVLGERPGVRGWAAAGAIALGAAVLRLA